MDSELNYLLHLTKAAIHEEDASAFSGHDVNWRNILELSRKHGMSAILYRTISRLPVQFQPEEELMALWKMEAFQMGVLQLRQNSELGQVLKVAAQLGIQLVPFKGILLAQLYPEPLMRISGDADIYVSLEQKDATITMLLERGYIIDEEESIDTVTVLNRNNVLSIELHTCLWEEYIGDRIRELERMGITDPKTFISARACDIQCNTLGINQHLIYQIYHMIKHFSLSGIGIRHLTDLTLYINYYFDQINQKCFWKAMQQLQYTTCCESFLYICVQCFGMNPEIFKEHRIQSTIEIEHLIEDIVDGGVFGNAKDERYHARNIIKPYLKNNKKVNVSKPKLIIGIIFPGLDIIKEQYAYANRHSVLIPFAWIQRNVYLLRKQFGKNKESYGEKTMNQAKYRLKLLEELEILNK